MERRAELEAALVVGESLRKLSTRFRVSDAAIRRHQDNHLNQTTEAGELTPVAEAADPDLPRKDGEVIRHVRKALVRCWGLYDRAERKRDGGREAMAALCEIIRQAELLGKVTGEVGPNAVTVVNITQTPQFLELQSKVLAVLQRHPAALADMRRAFAALEG